MYTYTLTYKTIPDLIVYIAQLQEINPNIILINYNSDNSNLSIRSNTEIYGAELSTINAITPENTPAQTTIENAIRSAIEFGNDLVIEFAAENVLLGITAAGQTNTVRKATSDITGALSTGSLYDAMTECRAIPAEDKDATFITDARLLVFINKIESYLGMQLSTSL